MRAYGSRRKPFLRIMFVVFGIAIGGGSYFIVSSYDKSSEVVPEIQGSMTQTLVDLNPDSLTQTYTPIATVTPLPSITPTERVCSETVGTIQFREFVTEIQPYPMACRVYLPPCYTFSTERDYPVLYILHGQSYNDDQWDRMGLDEAADQLITKGEIPPLIIVMPREPNTLADDKESLYGKALAEALIPWVDNEFRTDARRECRALGGLSRGAAWAMRIGFLYWNLFGAIGTHSFAPFAGDFNMFPYWLQEIPDGELPRIYMDIGTLDFMLTPAGNFENRLTKYGVPHEWIINSGTHNEEYWSSHVEDYLLWYTFPWKDQCQGFESEIP